MISDRWYSQWRIQNNISHSCFQSPYYSINGFNSSCKALVNLGIIFNDALSTRTIMGFIIPQTMEGWNIEVLRNILEIPDVEKESFDFKNNKVLEKSYRLEDHICAFANTYGGYIVIGVGEQKISENSKKFTLDGFDNGSQQEMLRKITQKIWLIEPMPLYEMTTIESQGKYQIILHIKSETHKRPFFAKNKSYIRIGSSTLPANRNVVLSMVNYNLIAHEDRKRHTEYIAGIFRQLTNLSIVKNNQNYSLAVLRDSFRLNPMFEKDILIIEEHTDIGKLSDLDKIYHLDLAISHLKCEEYHNKFKIFNEIKIVLDKININDKPIENLDFNDITNYPRHIVDYFKHNYKVGFKLYMLVLKFREEIFHTIRDLFAGDLLRGFCKIGY